MLDVATAEKEEMKTNEKNQKTERKNKMKECTKEEDIEKK